MYEDLINALRGADKTARAIKENPFRFSAYYVTAANVIEKLEKKVQRWISVSERLPEIREDVLSFTRYGGVPTVAVDFLAKDGLFMIQPSATHWMPLPEPPKDGE